MDDPYKPRFRILIEPISGDDYRCAIQPLVAGVTHAEVAAGLAKVMTHLLTAPEANVLTVPATGSAAPTPPKKRHRGRIKHLPL